MGLPQPVHLVHVVTNALLSALTGELVEGDVEIDDADGETV